MYWVIVSRLMEALLPLRVFMDKKEYVLRMEELMLRFYNSRLYPDDQTKVVATMLEANLFMLNFSILSERICNTLFSCGWSSERLKVVFFNKICGMARMVVHIFTATVDTTEIVSLPNTHFTGWKLGVLAITFQARALLGHS